MGYRRGYWLRATANKVLSTCLIIAFPQLLPLFFSITISSRPKKRLALSGPIGKQDAKKERNNKEDNKNNNRLTRTSFSLVCNFLCSLANSSLESPSESIRICSSTTRASSFLFASVSNSAFLWLYKQINNKWKLFQSGVFTTGDT